MQGNIHCTRSCTVTCREIYIVQGTVQLHAGKYTLCKELYSYMQGNIHCTRSYTVTCRVIYIVKGAVQLHAGEYTLYKEL